MSTFLGEGGTPTVIFVPVPGSAFTGTYIPRYIVSSDGTKDIQIDYDETYLTTLVNSSLQTQTNFFNTLFYTLGGVTNLTVFGGGVKGVNLQYIYNGSANNQVYLQMLDSIAGSFPGKFIVPPSGLKAGWAVNGTPLWQVSDVAYTMSYNGVPSYQNLLRR